jgi:hypothetical protein
MGVRIARIAFLVTTLGAHAVAQFETRTTFFLGLNGTKSFVVGDFNRDGAPDFATLNDYPEGSVQIWLGNGDGTFRMGSNYATKVGFYGVTASLRNNGILDLVFGGAGTDDVYVMLGNGDGTFQPPASYPTTAASFMIAIGDFTGDGILDVADLESTSSGGIVCNCIEVLPGNGDGTFGTAVSTIPVPYNIDGLTLAAGDFNNDGKLDVVVGGGVGDTDQLDVLLGNGNGTFTPNGFYILGALPTTIATGYFTSDKRKLDLALTNATVIDVLLGNGDGTFQDPVLYPTHSPSWLIAQDLYDDGVTDLAVTNGSLPDLPPPGVSVFKGNGDGSFQKGVFYRAGTGDGGQYVAAGDFNGDRKPDLLVLEPDIGYMITLLNTGTVSFSPTTPLTFASQAVGTTSGPQSVTLTNMGSAELKIQSMEASNEFEMKSTCGTRVAAGAKCKISATFSPTKKGVKTGAITVIDSASSKPQVIELLGTGT